MKQIYQLILKKIPRTLAMVTALGLSAIGSAVQAVGLDNGDYVLYIRASTNAGIAGSWQSSFTFGGNAPSSLSNLMTDTGATVTGSDGTPRGSGIGGDLIPVVNTPAVGRIGLRVNNNSITITSFSKDMILGTAGGDFVQSYQDTTTGPDASAAVTGAGGTGTIDPATGAMTLSLIGRQGSISAPNNLFNKEWNFDDVCGTGWTVYTTDSVSTRNADCSVKNTISGIPLVSLGDNNGDGVNDVRTILVSGGTIGNVWGGFAGAQYFEVWNVRILSAKLVADTASTPANTPITVSVLSNDTGLAPLAVSGATNAANGTVTFTAGGVTYTPNLGFTGADSFTYTVLNGNGETKTGGMVNVTVTCPQCPQANNDTATTNQNANVVIDAGSNDTVNNAPATYTVLSPPANGAAVVTNASTGAITYTPDAGFVGTDSFTYRVTDATLLTGDGTVTVTVNPFGLTSSGTYTPGDLAVSAGSTDGVLELADVQTDSGVVTQCVGGCFDFKVTGPISSPVRVVLPRLSGTVTAQNITDGLRYRKYISGAWRDFDTSATDQVASQPLTANGGCPLPGAGGWKTWTSAAADNVHVGDRCIRLTIADNGPNDSDPAVGAIADPSGAGAGIPDIIVVERDGVLDSFDNGCSISPVTRKPGEGGEWWFVAGFLVWLRVLLWRRRHHCN